MAHPQRNQNLFIWIKESCMGGCVVSSLKYHMLMMQLFQFQVSNCCSCPFCVGITGPPLIGILEIRLLMWNHCCRILYKERVGLLNLTLQQMFIPAPLLSKIDGCFQHIECKRFSSIGHPFPNLSCVACSRILQDNDFFFKWFGIRNDNASYYHIKATWDLHDQDYIHNGKKLVDPLDSPMWTLQLGAYICFFGAYWWSI